jgi:pyruvate kinase
LDPGAFPFEAVKMMASICHESEANLDYRTSFQQLRSNMSEQAVSVAEAIGSSAVKTALDLRASMLIVLTETGQTARYVAKYRPEAPVFLIVYRFLLSL